ncbi:hypothetical protein ACFX13_016772 [Malus domestica]
MLKIWRQCFICMFGLIRVHLLLFLLFTGTSLVVTLVCSIGNNHSHLGTWCWSQSGRTGKALNLITFHMPLWGAVLYNGFYIFSSDKHAGECKTYGGWHVRFGLPIRFKSRNEGFEPVGVLSTHPDRIIGFWHNQPHS